MIMNRLGKCSIAFSKMCSGDIPERMSEKEFCDCLQSYIAALEEKFPFEYSLFRTAVVRKTAELLSAYGIRVEKALRIVPTGIRHLDDALGGGLPKSTSTLLVVEHPRARDIFLKSFIISGIENGEHVVFLSTEMEYMHIRDAIISETGTKNIKNLRYLDVSGSPGYPQGSIVSENGRTIVPLNNIMIQHALVKSIKSLPKEEHKRVVIDAMRGLAPYYDAEDIHRMLATFIEGHRRWNCTLLVTCYPELGWCTGELKKIFDSVIVLTISGGEVRAIIEKFYGGVPEEKLVNLTPA
ncbi:MAG: hypothetical protein GXN98_04620 [Euryarchaeota archaeon]|nr:hypothetical protein [Euryarchaeota archaeon]